MKKKVAYQTKTISRLRANEKTVTHDVAEMVAGIGDHFSRPEKKKVLIDVLKKFGFKDPDDMVECIMSVINGNRDVKNGIRYSQKFLDFAVGIWCTSQSAAQMLHDANICCMPTNKTMVKYSRQMATVIGDGLDGFNRGRVQELKAKCGLTIIEHGRLLFDEMYISRGLVYDVNHNLVGFISDSYLNSKRIQKRLREYLPKDLFEPEDENDDDEENDALDVEHNFEQESLMSLSSSRLFQTYYQDMLGDFAIIGPYYFVEGSCNHEDVAKIVMETIAELENLDLHVLLLCSDSASPNTSFLKRLLLSGALDCGSRVPQMVSAPDPTMELCNLEFTHPLDPSRSIFYSLCSVHILKNLRNQLLASRVGGKKCMRSAKGPIVWDAIDLSYDADQEAIQKSRKAGKNHLRKALIPEAAVYLDGSAGKMSVSYAKKVFAPRFRGLVLANEDIREDLKQGTHEFMREVWLFFCDTLMKKRIAVSVDPKDGAINLGALMEDDVSNQSDIDYYYMTREIISPDEIISRATRFYRWLQRWWQEAKPDPVENFLSMRTFETIFFLLSTVVSFFRWVKQNKEKFEKKNNDGKTIMFHPARIFNQSRLESFFSELRGSVGNKKVTASSAMVATRKRSVLNSKRRLAAKTRRDILEADNYSEEPGSADGIGPRPVLFVASGEEIRVSTVLTEINPIIEEPAKPNIEVGSNCIGPLVQKGMETIKHAFHVSIPKTLMELRTLLETWMQVPVPETLVVVLQSLVHSIVQHLIDLFESKLHGAISFKDLEIFTLALTIKEHVVRQRYPELIQGRHRTLRYRSPGNLLPFAVQSRRMVVKEFRKLWVSFEAADAVKKPFLTAMMLMYRAFGAAIYNLPPRKGGTAQLPHFDGETHGCVRDDASLMNAGQLLFRMWKQSKKSTSQRQFLGHWRADAIVRGRSEELGFFGKTNKGGLVYVPELVPFLNYIGDCTLRMLSCEVIWETGTKSILNNALQTIIDARPNQFTELLEERYQIDGWQTTPVPSVAKKNKIINSDTGIRSKTDQYEGGELLTQEDKKDLFDFIWKKFSRAAFQRVISDTFDHITDQTKILTLSKAFRDELELSSKKKAKEKAMSRTEAKSKKQSSKEPHTRKKRKSRSKQNAKSTDTETTPAEKSPNPKAKKRTRRKA